MPVEATIGWDDPIIAIREADSEEYHVFHLWKQSSAEHGVDISTKATRSNQIIAEAVRPLPTRLNCTIRLADGGGNGDVDIPEFGPNAILQTDHIDQQIDRLISLLGKPVRAFTRIREVNGVVTRVSIDDDGRYDNSILVNVEITGVDSRGEAPITFVNIGTVELPTPNENTSVPGASTMNYTGGGASMTLWHSQKSTTSDPAFYPRDTENIEFKNEEEKAKFDSLATDENWKDDAIINHMVSMSKDNDPLPVVIKAHDDAPGVAKPNKFEQKSFLEMASNSKQDDIKKNNETKYLPIKKAPMRSIEFEKKLFDSWARYLV